MGNKKNLTPFELAELNSNIFALRMWILGDFQKLMKTAAAAEDDWIEAIDRCDKHLEAVLTETLSNIEKEIGNIAIALESKSGLVPMYN